MVCDGHAEAVRAMGFQRKAGQTLLTGKRKSFQRVWESLQAKEYFKQRPRSWNNIVRVSLEALEGLDIGQETECGRGSHGDCLGSQV